APDVAFTPTIIYDMDSRAARVTPVPSSMAASVPATRPTAAIPAGTVLSREQLLEIYYYLRLTRTLEERLVALYRQTKVIGGLFRSLGQEGESVASAYALERGRNKDILSPDRKSTRLNSSHDQTSYAVFCLKKKKKNT